MSERHPIIAITGSSGAGTTSVTQTFQNIFRREGVDAGIKLKPKYIGPNGEIYTGRGPTR